MAAGKYPGDGWDLYLTAGACEVFSAVAVQFNKLIYSFSLSTKLRNISRKIPGCSAIS